MNYILYQAYGNKDIINEAIYSLLSYFNIAENKDISNTKIIVYTDDLSTFELLFKNQDIIYIPVSPELIREWRGEINFVHRVKIKILQDFFSKYTGNALYIDSDTVFKENISYLFKAIDDGKFVMHTMEGVIENKGNLVLKKLNRFISAHEIPLSSGDKVKISGNTKMWNAGVLGFNNSQSTLLDKILELTDTMYKLYPKHIVEQLAFSYYFQNNGEIIPAEKSIFHYWNFKEFRKILLSFFNIQKGRDFGEMTLEIDKINPENLRVPKMEYEKLSGLGRILKKLKGEKWEAKMELLIKNSKL